MKLIIIGWFGSGNIGDEALLLSQIQGFTKFIPHFECDVVSFNPAITKKVLTDIAGVKNIYRLGNKQQVFKTQLVSIYRAMRRADKVVIGGGGMVQDVYNWYTFCYFAFFALLGKMLNKPVMLYGVGAGPILRKFVKQIIRLTGNQVDLITVRDPESKQAMIRAGIKQEKIIVTADPAFYLTPKIIPDLKLSQEKIKIGICVREVAQWKPLDKKLLAKLFDDLAVKYNAQIIFFAFGFYTNKWFKKQTSEPTDTQTAHQIASHMKNKPLIIKDHYRPDEFLYLISQFNLLISMRFHAALMAAMSQVPTLFLTYNIETKLKNLAHALDMNNALIIYDKIQRQDVLTKVHTLITDKQEIQTSLARQSAHLHDQAVKNFIFLRDLKNKQKFSAINFIKYFYLLITGGVWHTGKGIIYQSRMQ